VAICRGTSVSVDVGVGRVLEGRVVEFTALSAS